MAIGIDGYLVKATAPLDDYGLGRLVKSRWEGPQDGEDYCDLIETQTAPST